VVLIVILFSPEIIPHTNVSTPLGIQKRDEPWYQNDYYKAQKRRLIRKYLHHIIIEGISFLCLHQISNDFPQFPSSDSFNKIITSKPTRLKLQQVAQFNQNLQTNKFKIDFSMGSAKSSQESS